MNQTMEMLSRHQINDQCRAIRKKWSEIERLRRQEIAEQRQRWLAALLFAQHQKQAHSA
jgi:hypothetical protein